MNRVALITGGARGIGVGIARSLAAEGFDLVLSGSRDASAAAEVVDSLRRPGIEILYVQADVADTAARRRLVEAVRQHFGRLHVLVNNAGVAPQTRADILDASEESFDWVLGINLRGPHFLTQACANWMITQKQADAQYRGCIINVSSVSATYVSTNRSEYCISKAGMTMVTQLWAARLGEFDIPVYEVKPGVIHSDMTAGVIAKYDKLLAEGLAIQRRWGEPDDVGRAVAVLARGELPYSTGLVLTVDGGMMVPRLPT